MQVVGVVLKLVCLPFQELHVDEQGSRQGEFVFQPPFQQSVTNASLTSTFSFHLCSTPFQISLKSVSGTKLVDQRDTGGFSFKKY